MEDRAALQTWGPDGVLLWPCGEFSSRQACAVSNREAGEGEENNERKQKTKKKTRAEQNSGTKCYRIIILTLIMH
jgi:hypothetical protein